MLLSQTQINWLNKPFFNMISNWSLTHLVYGMLWGFTILDLQTFILLHSFFQVIELTCFFELEEFSLQDTLLESVLGIIGVFITKLSPKTSMVFCITFIGTLLSKR